ncbi:hypothetical protein SAMN05192588_2091 [Nonlabens sp. Hel1_33_55]|uniref:hypothetical protein n=1 Tax=Nonlabens sp. Hel1_33_55 TaxID=1336802 RepID=UPI000875E697|nr:hypothetical protein [Nonlabens sp. Hel1_33_55]SCY29283.1 hypothetical protein SAMN05192588_2091 [Nonlabens sp. Hel1_33_55]
MKNYLPLIFLFFSFFSTACSCVVPTITTKYAQSDFVANITIIKKYPNTGSEEFYRADVRIKELFKGEKVKSIYVSGRSDGKIGSSCSIYIPEGTNLIAYSQRNKGGFLKIGMCSGLLYLDKASKSDREIEILEEFKAKNISFIDKINYREKSDLRGKLKQFDGIELDKKFGLFQIILNSNLSIKSVEEIHGFANTIDDELIVVLKESKWIDARNRSRINIAQDSKILVGFYYHPKANDKSSFLTYF